MSKYNFVKNCDIPEPPKSPIVVPEDSPINPLISLPLNPTIPLELIAKFLPCKYKDRFPCPEIKVENLNDLPGSSESVKYNCQGKSELTVDFDIESYCCDVIEDENGNEVDHDKIVLTSRSELTLPYPQLVTSGALYYLDAVELDSYIGVWNANHTDQLSLCDRCWTDAHRSAIRALNITVRQSRWYFYAFNDDPVPDSSKHYLYPLVDVNDNYFRSQYAFKTGERVVASLDRCRCKARFINRYNDGVAVKGIVCGTCSQSYAQITGLGDDTSGAVTSGEEDHFWGVNPDYPVAVGATFTGYLSKTDNKVYANVPRAENKIYSGYGIYTGEDCVENITWHEGGTSVDPVLTSTTSITRYETANQDLPIGAKVAVRKECNPCSEEETNTITNADYNHILPAAATEDCTTVGNTVLVTLYSQSGSVLTPGDTVSAINYMGPVQMGDRGMVSFCNGAYYFFKKGPDEDTAPEPVIHQGLQKHFSNLNGYAVAKTKIKQSELSSLTTYEKDLLLVDTSYSTVKTIAEKGVAEINQCTVKFTEDRTGKALNYHCDYWLETAISGEPYNYPISHVKDDGTYVICHNSSNVSKKVTLANTLKKKELHVTIEPTEQNPNPDPAYDTISNVEYTGLLYEGDRIYGPWSGVNGSFGQGSDYYWSGHFGSLGVLCGSRDASLVEAPLTGDTANYYRCTYKAYNRNVSDQPVFTFMYNPLVKGFEAKVNSTTTYKLLDNSYEVKTDGLYKIELPKRYYKISGSTLTNASNITDTTTVNLIDLLKGKQYRIKSISGDYHIYPGTLILKGTAYSPIKSSHENTYYYVPSQDPGLTGNVTFTFTMTNLQDRSYTPLDIFNYRTNGWFQRKNLVFKSSNDSSFVVVDKNSFSKKPFTNNSAEIRLYYWDPDVRLQNAEYTFKEFFKDSNTFATNGETITQSLTSQGWYPVTYDSNIGKYRLTVNNSNTSCYALYSTPTIPLDQTIHFTFTKAQDVDTTVRIRDAIQYANKVKYKTVNNVERIYVNPGSSYYWTCPATVINCDVEPKLPDLTVELDTSSGSFTGYCWTIKERDEDPEEETGSEEEET